MARTRHRITRMEINTGFASYGELTRRQGIEKLRIRIISARPRIIFNFEKVKSFAFLHVVRYTYIPALGKTNTQSAHIDVLRVVGSRWGDFWVVSEQTFTGWRSETWCFVLVCRWQCVISILTYWSWVPETRSLRDCILLFWGRQVQWIVMNRF